MSTPKILIVTVTGQPRSGKDSLINLTVEKLRQMMPTQTTKIRRASSVGPLKNMLQDYIEECLPRGTFNWEEPDGQLRSTLSVIKSQLDACYQWTTRYALSIIEVATRPRKLIPNTERVILFYQIREHANLGDLAGVCAAMDYEMEPIFIMRTDRPEVAMATTDYVNEDDYPFTMKINSTPPEGKSLDEWWEILTNEITAKILERFQ